MKRRTILRESRLVHAAVGATVLAGPASAALADPSHTSSAQGPTGQADPGLEARVNSRRLHYGQAEVVTGHAPASDAGQSITLDFAPAGSNSWQQIAAGRISQGGAFRLTAPLRRSGAVRVTAPAQPSTPAMVIGAQAASASSTAPQRVSVAAAIQLRRRSHNVLGSQIVHVHGGLVPRAARHRVLLQGRNGGRWLTLASARTSSVGGFDIRYPASHPGQQRLRVRFPGDGSNAAISVPAGWLTVFRQSMASWYDDGGTTACGFHAYYGVANLSLPCGSHVTLSNGGSTITATVDDRGPYVGGREWDLNQNTAAALGFGGIGAVWSSR